jgi:hypothetical protein
LPQEKDKYRNTATWALRFCFTRSVRDRVATEAAQLQNEGAQYQSTAPNTKERAALGHQPEIKMRRDQ